MILCDDARRVARGGRDRRAASRRRSRAPFVIAGVEHFVTASIGIALAAGAVRQPPQRRPDPRGRRRDVPREGARPRTASSSSTKSCARSATTRLRLENELRRTPSRTTSSAALPADRLARRRPRSSASRRSSAGSTPSAACSRPTSSSPSPRRPARSSRSARWVLRDACRSAATGAPTAPSAGGLRLASTSRCARSATPTAADSRARRSPRAGLAPGSPAPRDHRERADGGHRPRPRDAAQAESARRAARARRLRHRLLVARLPPALPDRHAQDRPQLRRRPRRLRHRLGDRRRQSST